MSPKGTSERLAEAVERLHRRLQVHSQSAGAGARASAGPALTIALSRQAGAGGTEVARRVGERLGWPVYDRERDAFVRDHFHKN